METTFKAKLFKLGNSKAIYVPKVINGGLKDGSVYTWKLVEDPKGLKMDEVEVNTDLSGIDIHFNKCLRI